MALDKQTIPVVFQGLDQGTATQLVLPGKFLVLENCLRRKEGKVQKRPGFAALGKTISGTSDEVASGNRVDTFQDDLLLLNSDAIYSYSSTNDSWIDKGDLVSVTVESRPVIRNGASQTLADAAYLGGATAYVWEDSRGGCRISVIDQETGASLIYDTVLNASGARPKVVALRDKFVVFYIVSTTLYTRTIDRTSPSVLGAETSFLTSVVNGPYDVCAYTNTAGVFAANTTSADIKIGYFLQSGAIGNGTNGAPSPVEITSATSLGTAALSVFTNAPLGHFFVLYYDATTDVFTNIAAVTSDLVTIDTYQIESVNDVRNLTGVVTTDNSFTVYTEASGSTAANNFIRKISGSWTLGGSFTFGASAMFKRSIGLYSKAFYRDGFSYITAAHDSTLQPTYFTIRSDGQIVTKMLPGLGGGISAKTGSLVSVPVYGDGYYSIPLEIRVQLKAEANATTLSSNTGLQRAKLSFDQTNFDAATLGQNYHVAGGIVLAYDSVSATELGFHLYPEGVTVASNVGAPIACTFQDAGDTVTKAAHGLPAGTPIAFATIVTTTGISTNTVYYVINPLTDTFQVAATVGGSALPLTSNGSGTYTVGALTNTSYSYRAVYEWLDGKGQVHQSAPSITATVTNTLAANTTTVTVPTLRLTQKTGIRSPVRIVLYRAAAGLSSVYYRLSNTSTATGEIDNDLTTNTVTLTDNGTGFSTSSAVLYTTGGVLENIAPPSCAVAHKHKGRLFLAGLEDQDAVVYSKENVFGEGVAFTDAYNPIRTAPEGGKVTALGTLDDKLVIFKKGRSFSIVGEGPLDTGAQNDYLTPQAISGDIGCDNPRSTVSMPKGLMFKSDKGFYLLTRSLEFIPIGAAVQDFDDLTVTSAVSITSLNEVRFTTSDGVTLVYNYEFDQWSVFTNYEAVSACNGLESYLHLKSDGTVNKEDTSSSLDNGARIKMAMETSWFSFSGVQGYQRIYYIGVLGDFVSHHYTEIKMAFNFEDAFTEQYYYDTITGQTTETYGDGDYGDQSPYGGSGSSVYQWRLKPAQQKCESIKVRLEDIDTITSSGGGSFNLVSMAFTVGVKQGINRQGSAKTVG